MMRSCNCFTHACNMQILTHNRGWTTFYIYLINTIYWIILFRVYDETCDEITMPLLSAILQGKFLDGYVFGNIPVLDKNFCLIQCLHQRQCKSVNYEEDTSLCYLNNEEYFIKIKCFNILRNIHFIFLSQNV
jgi:hypothetical protein